MIPKYRENNNYLNRYEEADKGPEFVRCALKSCEILKILHLSLPDNMIGEYEMPDIAYLLAQNPPLKTLNLSYNIINEKAGCILA